MSNIVNEVTNLISDIKEFCRDHLLYDTQHAIEEKVKKFIRKNYSKNFSLTTSQSDIFNHTIYIDIDFGKDIRCFLAVRSGYQDE